MDRFQERIIRAIDKRENCSLKNDTRVWNSYHTENDFNSYLFVNDEHIATVYYRHSINDLNFNCYGGTLTYNNFDHDNGDYIKAIENDNWAIDEIVFNERAIDRVLGTNAVRYRNFLMNHYIERGIRCTQERYVTV